MTLEGIGTAAAQFKVDQWAKSMYTVLASISHDKFILTTASREQAERVLDLQGIKRRFIRIVDVRDMGYKNKPEPAA